MTQFIIAGTGTDVGKTLCAALLMSAMKGSYWKPVQCGTDEDGRTDYDTVKQLSGLDDAHFIAPAYSLKMPLSPHRASEMEDIEIDIGQLQLPRAAKSPLLVEGAGGLMVPLNRTTLYIDLFLQWNIPVVLCARTGLGTINHTLLSIEALRTRDISIHGIVFLGPENQDNRNTIIEMGSIRELGYIPQLKVINKDALLKTFDRNFNYDDWQ